MSRGFQVLRVDDKRDLMLASDGRSRFGAYLRQNSEWFAAGLDGMPAEFAATALRVALPPVMSPGYVTSDARVTDVQEDWDDDGRLAIAVTLVSQLPARLERVCGRWSGWTRERDLFGSGSRWSEPMDNSRLAALPLLRLRVPIPAEVLPAPRYDAGLPDVTTAKRAVQAIVSLVNRDLAPVLVALDAGGAVA